jgi:TonB family protein
VKKFLVLRYVVGAGMTLAGSDVHAADMRPAMIGKGADSVATHLHYPVKAKAAEKQAAVTFYCEVGTDGRPAHVQLDGKGKGGFTAAVEQALRTGRFEPARIEGQPVPVILGGTVLFVLHGHQPRIVVSLATTDKEKIAGMANYIQPQLIGTNAELRRKVVRNSSGAGTNMAASPMEPSLISYRTFDIDYVPAGHSRAEVMVHVDQHGNLTRTRILAESPPNGNLGKSLAQAVRDAKFIPALSDGRPAAGDFNLPFERGAM